MGISEVWQGVHFGTVWDLPFCLWLAYADEFDRRADGRG